MELVLDQLVSQWISLHFLISHCFCFLDGQVAGNVTQPEGFLWEEREVINIY